MKFVFALLCFSTVVFANSESEVQRVKKKLASVPNSTLLAEGKGTYAKRCARCHGMPGTSKGWTGFSGPDLSKGIYKFRSTPSGSNPREADIWRSITAGIPGTRMSSFKFLSERDRWGLVVYLKSLSDYFEDAEEPEAVPIPAPPKDLNQSIERGKHLYLLVRCYDCHGFGGAGDGVMAKGLKDGQGRPAPPASFTRGRYKSGDTPQDLYRTLLTGLDGSPMAAFDDGALLFSREQQKLTEGRTARYPVAQAIKKQVDPKTVASLQKFIDGLLTQSEIEKMSEEEKMQLAAKRRWDLVHYVRSLRK